MNVLGEIRDIAAELQRRSEFHDDSEVKWHALHEAPSDILEGGDPTKCAVCGNDVLDDRWHYRYIVSTNTARFAEQAHILQKLPHAMRRQIDADNHEIIRRALGLDQ